MILPLLIVGKKPLILQVLNALLNMKGQWHSLEQIAPNQLIILLKIIKQGLLIPQIKIINQMIVNPTLIR